MPTWRMTLVRPTRCTSIEVAGGAPPQVRADGLPTTRAAGPGPAAGADRIPDQHQLAVAGRTGPGRFLDAVERQARDPPDRRGNLPAWWYSVTASGTTARTPYCRPARATGVTVTTGDLGPGVTAGLLPGARPRTRRGLRSRLRAAPRPPAPSGSGGASPRLRWPCRSRPAAPARTSVLDRPRKPSLGWAAAKPRSGSSPAASHRLTGIPPGRSRTAVGSAPITTGYERSDGSWRYGRPDEHGPAVPIAAGAYRHRCHRPGDFMAWR
jgi:hypothetical protein